MKEIKVYTVIADEQENVFMSMFGFEDAVFSASTVSKILEDNADENEFMFKIHCNGGSVTEGLAIYDILRNSGKTIFCNVDGGCHSMALVLLLAAPKENRTANANARALIHKVRGFSEGTIEDMEAYVENMKREQDNILDIYEERTGYDRAALEQLMKEEKIRSANELLTYGFISKINSYNTNQNKTKMTKPNAQSKKLSDRISNFFDKLDNLLNGEVVNYDFTDADGNVLFSTEKEDDSLEVGDAVTLPDGSTEGTFELPDGRTVVIAEGKVSEIQEPAADEATVEELQNQVEELTNLLSDAREIINELKKGTTSNYKPVDRNRSGKSAGAKASKEDLKNEAAEKRKTFKSGRAK